MKPLWLGQPPSVTTRVARIASAEIKANSMQRLIDGSDLDRQGVYDHRAWLETVHLVATLPAWSRGLTARAARRPKVYVTDPGLAAWLLGRDTQALAAPHPGPEGTRRPATRQRV